jgi:tRNA pseudouridine synthase 10
MLGHGLTNEERGNALKLVSIIEGSRLKNGEDMKWRETLESIATNGFSDIAAETLRTLGIEVKGKDISCYLCRGAFQHIDELAQDAIVELSKYDYASFLVGVKVDAEVEDREDDLHSKFGIRWGENIRNEFSREIGKRIMEKTMKKVDLRRPDILVIVNPLKEKIRLIINSLFISGRYRKMVRGIPQSRWFCSECGGKGCQRCGWTGKLYSDSVEELITGPLLEMTKGLRVKLHASGREDLDVRTLGSGRPFVAEVMKPQERKIDLEKLRRDINQRSEGKIEVNGLTFSSKDAVKTIKRSEKSAKVYRAVVEFERDLDKEAISAVKGLNNRLIEQLTPLRVTHRRAIKIRKRYLYEIKVKMLKPNLVEMLLRCEGGLYVKELMHGDEGRTTPSVTEVVGIPVKSIVLDVMSIEMGAST